MFVNEGYPAPMPPYQGSPYSHSVDIFWGLWLRRIGRAFVVLFVLSFLALLFISNFMGSCDCGNPRSAAIGSLRTLNASQAIFLERSPFRRYGSLTELMKDGYIDEILGKGEKRFYNFQVAHRKLEGKVEYWVKASPVSLEDNEYHFYYTNQTGIIYFSSHDFEPGFHNYEAFSELTPLFPVNTAR